MWVAGRKTLKRVDALTGRVGPAARLGRELGGIAADARAVWVFAPHDGVLLRVDPRTRHVVATIRVGRSATANSVSLGALVWTTTNRGVVAVDPRSNRVVRRVPVPRANAVRADGSGAIVYAADGLYDVGGTGRAIRRLALPEPSLGLLATRGGTIWISEGVTSTLRRLAPR